MVNLWWLMRTLMAIGLLMVTQAVAVTADNTITPRPNRCAGTIAFTFDDGPNTELTPVVLDILAKHGIKTTFFVIGSEIDGDEAIIQRMVAEGHQVQNHTWNHPYLTQLSDEEVLRQLDQTSAAIVAAGAPTPVYVRPPYGDYTPHVLDLIESRGMTAVTWTNALDIRDWDGLSSAEIIDRVITNLEPGGVVLLHDIQPNTVAALPDLINAVHQQGYCINQFRGEEFWHIDA